MMARWYAAAILILGGGGVTAFAQTPGITSLDYLNQGTRISRAEGVSPNGQVVTGQSRTTNTRDHVFLWSAPIGPMQDLGAFVPQPTASIDATGNDVSANGVVVGTTRTVNAAGPQRAFRKIGAGAIDLIPLPAGLPANAAALGLDVSDEGNTIVGLTSNGGVRRGFVFNAQNNQSLALGTIAPNTGESAALACSANGAVIAGWSSFGSTFRPCTFTIGGNATDLGTINNDPNGFGFARDVSADGQFIVGQCALLGVLHAFRWTQAGGMIDLGSLGTPSNASDAFAISRDGSVIVGESVNPGFGGRATIWFGPGTATPLLTHLQSLGANTAGWTTLDICNDISDDGTVVVGTGTFNGQTTAFRVTLPVSSPPPPNSLPTVSLPGVGPVECNGGQNLVTLTATVNDADAADRLTVTWSVNGAAQPAVTNVVPGTTVPFTFNYPDGATAVSVSVTDGKSAPVATSTTVTIVDTKVPIVVVASEVTKRVDKGEIFATINLPRPSVSDVCDPAPVVTNNAPAGNRFPIGRTNVVWTVRDKSGNVATATQIVKVENQKPTANAGADIVRKSGKLRTTVQLNGNRSRDPDKQDLTFLWSAPGTKIADPAAARTSGRFKQGVTRVQLTVTDEAGAKSTDLMIVRIQKSRVVRRDATQADAAVRAAHDDAAASVASGGGASAAAGLALTKSAYALGALAGTDANVKGDAGADDLTTYLALRQQQSHVARQAGDQFVQAFLASGDEFALAAALSAYGASGHAQADLSSNELTDVLVAEISKE